jgi:hypothetical protein
MIKDDIGDKNIIMKRYNPSMIKDGREVIVKKMQRVWYDHGILHVGAGPVVQKLCGGWAGARLRHYSSAHSRKKIITWIIFFLEKKFIVMIDSVILARLH